MDQNWKPMWKELGLDLKAHDVVVISSLLVGEKIKEITHRKVRIPTL